LDWIERLKELGGALPGPFKQASRDGIEVSRPLFRGAIPCQQSGAGVELRVGQVGGLLGPGAHDECPEALDFSQMSGQRGTVPARAGGNWGLEVELSCIRQQRRVLADGGEVLVLRELVSRAHQILSLSWNR